MFGVIKIKDVDKHNTIKTFDSDKLMDALEYAIKHNIVPHTYFMQDDDIEDGTAMSVSVQEVADTVESGEIMDDLSFF